MSREVDGNAIPSWMRAITSHWLCSQCCKRFLSFFLSLVWFVWHLIYWGEHAIQHNPRRCDRCDRCDRLSDHIILGKQFLLCFPQTISDSKQVINNKNTVNQSLHSFWLSFVFHFFRNNAKIESKSMRGSHLYYCLIGENSNHCCVERRGKAIATIAL